MGDIFLARLGQWHGGKESWIVANGLYFPYWIWSMVHNSSQEGGLSGVINKWRTTDNIASTCYPISMSHNVTQRNEIVVDLMEWIFAESGY